MPLFCGTHEYFAYFHGFFSLGGLVGSGAGGLALANGLSSMLHAYLIGGLMLIATTFTFRSFLPKKSDASQDGSKFVLPRGPVLALGAFAFMVLMAEGAIADWSAVYSKNILAIIPQVILCGQPVQRT